VNYNNFKFSSINIGGLGFWFVCFAIAWLLGSILPGWLVNSFLFLTGLIILLPIVAVVGFRWWIQRNLAQGQCPVCASELTSLNNVELRCPNCQEPLKVERGHFTRLTAPGTIEVQAVEVQAQVVDD
jgi:hypothetical protein